MDIFKTVQKLTETPGPSGWEGPIAEVVQTLFEPFVDDVRRDRMGNILAIKHGQASGDKGDNAPRLLIAAHMDEIALMVKHIEQYPRDDASAYGFMRLTNVGGVDIRHLYGQRVIVHGRRDLPGIIGALPEKMRPEGRRGKSYNFDELVVDVGLPADAVRELVAVGDFISFRQPLRKFMNKRVSGKALDNRASVAAAIVAMEYLSSRLHDWDVIAIATVQEETRLLGAYTSAYEQRPDVAVAVDVTFAKGPGAKDGQLTELDDGPTLGLGPNVHPGVFKKLKSAADRLEMKVRPEPHARASGTDAFGLQIARAGIPTGLVSIPLRYMHTMVESIALADVERTGRLLGEFAVQLGPSFLEEIAQEMMAE